MFWFFRSQLLPPHLLEIYQQVGCSSLADSGLVLFRRWAVAGAGCEERHRLTNTGTLIAILIDIIRGYGTCRSFAGCCHLCRCHSWNIPCFLFPH
jgi:hypothetical protein